MLLFAIAAVALVLIMAKKSAAGTTGDSLEQFKQELRQPPADVQKILAGVAAGSGVPLNLLKAFAWVESRFKANAVNMLNPTNPSMGMFQIRPIPWLKHLNLGDDRGVLFDALTNAQAGADIIKYFQSRGYRMPQQADVYNLGEPQYNADVRNADYNAKINIAFDWFQSH